MSVQDLGQLGDPAFDSVCDSLLRTVRKTGTHAHLIDIREALKPAVTKDRPLVMLCPHADDGAISAGCLIHEYAVRRGMPVHEVLVFAGERNVDAAWLNESKKVGVREAEFRLECNVLGSEAVCWDLEAYRSPGYQPTHADLVKIIDWFKRVHPGALIVPPATDGHMAHRMTRALAAIGLIGADLSSTLVLSGWTPWGPLPRPNAFFTYDEALARTKAWAINCHASQVRLTDYTEFCEHLGQAYASLVREWAEGHRITSSRAPKELPFDGVELFQIENFEPALAEGSAADPMQIAMGVLGGQLSPETLILNRD
jgi:LmbE family N-acetylglucosaminyl deacetylase